MQVLHETAHMMILNKPRRVHSDQLMLTHRTMRHWVAAHRLDFETSGCLLVCDPSKFENYSTLFKMPAGKTPTERARKFYLAGTTRPTNITHKVLRVEGFVVSRYRRSKKVQFLNPWDPDINKKWHSKRAVSHMVSKIENLSDPQIPSGLRGELHCVELITGARHQIRSYFASLGCPLVGDPIYGSEDSAGLCLHAWKLEFKDPLSGDLVKTVATSIENATTSKNLGV